MPKSSSSILLSGVLDSAANTQEVKLGGEFVVPADAQLPIKLVFHPQRPGKRAVDYEFRNLKYVSPVDHPVVQKSRICSDYRNVEVVTLTALVATHEHTVQQHLSISVV